MATLYSKTNGTRAIQFYLDDVRKTIRLGPVARKSAEMFRLHVEHLLNARLMQTAAPSETAGWLSTLPDETYGKLARTGLVPERQKAALCTMGELTARYKALLASKAATAVFYGHTLRNLESYFGADKPLASISNSDADGFRPWLLATESLAPATANRRVVATKSIFRKAVRWAMVPSNVFDGVKGGAQSNETRKHFVSPADTARLIEACPDVQWKCLIALSRFGGLRVPSEALLLTWADVNWDRGTLHVKSPKTEHHAGMESRVVPLFPELRKILMGAFESAEPGGAPWIITKYRDAGQNLRTQLGRIIRRAGLAEWPKPFHNMRASRQSELMAEYDLSTACQWLGNSPVVAARHYAMATDRDGSFQRAIGEQGAPDKALQKALQSMPELTRTDANGQNAEGENHQEIQGNSLVCTGIHNQGTGRYRIRTCDLMRVMHAL